MNSNRRLPLVACGLMLAALLFWSNCKFDSGILARSQEYFPLADSTTWTYLHDDGTTSKVFVRGDSSAFGHPCIVVEEDAAERYWFKGDGEVRKFVDYTINIGGTDYPLEQLYRRYLVLPLVAGNSWSEKDSVLVPVLGVVDTFVHTISGRVTGTSTVRVPFGSYAQCYEVDFTEVISLNGAADTTLSYEWYAPGIGLVMRVRNDTAKLVDYQVR